MNNRPILYTFRRCPYAMRARLGLHLSGLNPQVREIELRNKPEAMLAASPKGTVPVLVLPAQTLQDTVEQEPVVIEESLQIMQYALKQQAVASNSPLNYANESEYKALLASIEDKTNQQLIEANDQQFKPWLDKYKYADRHLDYSQEYYRDQACEFIQQLESCLTNKHNLCADDMNLADIAIFPFIRQFAHVDKPWFDSSPFPKVRDWLARHMQSALFEAVMQKYPLWLDDPKAVTYFKS